MDLPPHSHVHLVFHVSRLRKRLGDDANIGNTGVLINFIEPLVKSPKLERILDFHEQCTRHHVCKQALVKWKDTPEEGSTWENISVLKKRFLTFFFYGKKLFHKGGVFSRQGSLKDKIIGKSLTI